MRAQRSGSSDVRLRAYRPSDFEGLLALDRECFEAGIAYSRGELARFLALATREVVIAESNEQIAGFCIGHRFPRHVARIITLDVRAEARRSGLGRSLLEETIALLVGAGGTETLLEVDVRNGGAIAFYLRLGFHRRDTISDYYGPGLAALEMFRRETGTPGGGGTMDPRR